MRLGATGLLLILGVAFVLHLASHEVRWDLLAYAGGFALFVPTAL